MKHSDIEHAFDAFLPSEPRREKIYRSIINGHRNTGQTRRVKTRAWLAGSLAAGCALMAACILLLGQGSGAGVLPEPNITAPEAGQTTPDNSHPAVTDPESAFSSFIFTVYTANSESAYYSADYTQDAQKKVLTPDVKVLLAKYTPAMSSVPGLPFTVDIAGSDTAIETIRVSVDSGDLAEWNQDTGVVSSKGQMVVINAGDTLYWSPLTDGDGKNGESVTILVEAMTGSTAVGRQKIYITRDSAGYYSASVGELELL